MNLAQKILEHRKKLGLSQEELSEKLGVSRQSVSKWESDQAKPEVDKLVSLSRLFGISLDQLIMDTPTIESLDPKIHDFRTPLQRWFPVVITGILIVALFISLLQLWSQKEEVLILRSELAYLKHQQSSTESALSAANLLVFQLREDLILQNGALADYRSEIDLINYINESITYKIMMLPKYPQQTSGIVLNVKYSDGSNRDIIATLSEDHFYTGYITVYKDSGGASLSLSVSTSTGLVNQVMDSFGEFEAVEESVLATPVLSKTDNTLTFAKNSIELITEPRCLNGKDAFEGTYSFQIIRNDNLNPAFRSDWDSNGPDLVCSQAEQNSTNTSLTVIPMPALKLDFKVGDVISLNLVRITNGQQKITVIQTYTRNQDGSLHIQIP